MARYLKNTGDLFQHIPRTGGTWVENAIWNCGIPFARWHHAQPGKYAIKHCILGLYYRKQITHINRSFAFVRRPLPYYRSTWNWIRRTKVGGATYVRKIRRYKWHPFTTAFHLYRPNFNAWLEVMLDEEPLWYTRLLELYVGPEGGEFCNYIGRTETIDSDFCEVMTWLGYGKNIEDHEEEIIDSPKKNCTLGDNDDEWDPSLKDEVEYSERLVLKRFYGDNEGKRFFFPVSEGRDIRAVGC